jgi:hypothetical protein
LPALRADLAQAEALIELLIERPELAPLIPPGGWIDLLTTPRPPKYRSSETAWIPVAALAVIGVIGLGIFGAVLTAQSSGPHFSYTVWTAAACHLHPADRAVGRRYPTASMLAGQDNQAASDSVYR